MINKIIQLLVLFFTLLSFNWVNAFVYNDYYSESINNFINSPSKIDLDSIENKTTRLCERIYLEATRRRDYTENELTLCSDITLQKTPASGVPTGFPSNNTVVHP